MKSTVHALYPPEPDLDTAIDFLQTLNPDGWQCLSAIREGVVADHFFKPGMWEEKWKLMAEWAAEKRNIYVLVNEPKANAESRKNADIAYIRAVFSDTDNKIVRDRALAAIDDPTACQAAFVNDSGGGIHTFFILADKLAVTPASQTMAENVGRGLRAYFAGDAVQNISRIMRVPGTVNYLDARKRARGREIALSTVLAKGEGRVTLEDMLRDYPPPPAAASAEVPAEAIRAAMAEIDMAVVGEAGGEYAKLPAGLRARFEKSGTWTLWTEGLTKGDDVSCSAHVFRLALIMHREGFTATEFGAVADCWTLVKPTNVEHRQLGRAWAKTKPVGVKEAFSGDLPPEIEPEPAKPRAKLIGVVGTDPAKFPRRGWIYGRRLIRGYLSSTVAAGGTGKSSLTMVEGVAMASGRDLLGVGTDKMPREPMRVLIWNGEDPAEELMRRFLAIQKHYGVSDAEIGGRLFLASGREYPLGLGGGTHKDDVRWLKEIIDEHSIDVVIIDPFVSSHSVPENDNVLIDKVAKTWSRLAETKQCAVDLVHHIRKPGNGGAMDLTVDDARGASALINASRNARVLSPMSADMGDRYQVNRKAYFAIHHDATKANMAPGAEGVDWFHFISVDLGNGDWTAAPPVEGDSVGVIEAWVPDIPITDDPKKIMAVQDEIAKGSYRMSDQSEYWVGNVVAEVLGLDIGKSRKFIKATITGWIKSGWLLGKEGKDENYNKRMFCVVGKRPDPSQSFYGE